MKKSLFAFVVAALFAANSFASYIVILKDGTRYRAKDRWTLVNGKAMLRLENGTTLAIDPSLIDVAKTNEQNTSGLGDARLIGVKGEPPPEKKQQVSSLGQLTNPRLFNGSADDRATSGVAGVGREIREVSTGGGVSADVLSRFSAAYENVGLYDARVTAGGPGVVKVELVADNEDQVFKALSATAFLVSQLPSKLNVSLNSVDLSMRTIRGGAAGRFNMTPADAQALDRKTMTLQQYYIARVMF